MFDPLFLTVKLRFLDLFARICSYDNVQLAGDTFLCVYIFCTDQESEVISFIIKTIHVV